MSQLNVNTIGARTGSEVAVNSGNYIHQAGIPIQVVTYMNPITAHNTINSTSFSDIEQSSGVNFTVTITPKKANSKILFQGQFVSYHEYGQKYAYVQALRDINGGTSDTVVWNGQYRAENSANNYNDDFPVMYQFIDAPNTTSAVTYHFQARVEHSDAEFSLLNYSATNRQHSVVMWEIGV